MSDSFADLWNSSAPQKVPQNLGSLAQKPQAPQQNKRTQQDIFSLLSSSTTASPSPTRTPLRSHTPVSNSPRTNSSGDAFSSLLSGSTLSTASTKNLTIAQRAALVDKQKKEALQAQQHKQQKEESTWSGLDSLNDFGKSSSISSVSVPSISSSIVSSGTGTLQDDWGLADFGSVHPPAPSKVESLSLDPQDDSLLHVHESPPSQPSGITGKAIWDFDDLVLPSSSSSLAQDEDPLSKIKSSSAGFDFGSSGSNPTSGSRNEDDVDDLMRAFNRPSELKSAPSSADSLPQHEALPSAISKPRPRSMSPPPHALGKIVEMGFPVAQARKVLADHNNDVTAAIEDLLSRSNNVPARSITTPEPPGNALRRDRERERRNADNDSNDIQAHAEQLLVQASEFGRGMFTKASLLWKEGKERVQKVVEEQVVGVKNTGSSAGGSASGRPRWMQEGMAADKNPSARGLKGDLLDPQIRIPRRLDRQRERDKAHERLTVPEPSPTFERPEPTVDIFNLSMADLSSSTQNDPSRRNALSAEDLSSNLSASAPPNHKPKILRDLTPVPVSAAKLKAEANAAFKLGQFGNAEALYTKALNVMDGKNHVYLILLLNNRAIARTKIGDINGAVKDCNAVLGIICENKFTLLEDLELKTGDDYHIKVEWTPDLDGENGDGKIQVHLEDGTSEVVDLCEGLIKAVKRRAEAHEAMEKWTKAKMDWEWLRNVSWRRDSVRTEAGKGVDRCMKMLGVESGASLRPPNKSRLSSVSPTPRSTVTVKPKLSQSSSGNKSSEAVAALRNANALAEAEDNAKYALKDRVDAKLANWRNGKETNLRALLASLDLVLWEELLAGGVKVGMHELVTPAQVKVKYMKAVAKVHPDKLNVNNSTLEQRMIAQGVFGALNEAWNAFKE